MNALLLLLSCTHQYLAIPGATPVKGYDLGVNEAVPAPVWTVEEGELPDAVDESVTLNLQLDPAAPFETAEIVVTVWITATLSYAEYWVYEVSDEEREAGEVSMEVLLTSTRPSEEYCARSHTGRGTCYGPVDEGITTTGWLASSGDGGESSMGAGIPISLPPADGGAGPQACQTFEDCCGCVYDPNLGTNICPLECYETPSCGCPAGTNDRGEGPDGLRACECPA